MLTLNIIPILKARGVQKPYTFLVSKGFNSHTANVLLNSTTVSFRLKHIEKLCLILNVTPNELLLFTPDKNTIVNEDHPINKLSNKNTDLNWQETIQTIPLDQLKEIVTIIKKHGNKNNTNET